MKKIHFLFCLLLLQLSLSNLVYGQLPSWEQADSMRDEIPRNAPLVFEGYTIAQGKEFVGKDRQTYIAVLIKIEKVLRGNIQLGYAEYARPSFNGVDSAGNIVGRIQSPYSHIQQTSPVPNQKSTFFSKFTADDNVLNYPGTENIKQITAYSLYAGQIVHRLEPQWTDGIKYGWGPLLGFTDDESFKAFMSKYGLGDKPAPPTVIKITPPYQKKSKDGKNPLSIDGKSVMFYDLMLDMINPITTISGSNTFFEFDVVGNANGTPSYLDSLRLQFNYNTAAFGSNISATE